jgi:hypothetical protein
VTIEVKRGHGGRDQVVKAKRSRGGRDKAVKAIM